MALLGNSVRALSRALIVREMAVAKTFVAYWSISLSRSRMTRHAGVGAEGRERPTFGPTLVNEPVRQTERKEKRRRGEHVHRQLPPTEAGDEDHDRGHPESQRRANGRGAEGKRG